MRFIGLLARFNGAASWKLWSGRPIQPIPRKRRNRNALVLEDLEARNLLSFTGPVNYDTPGSADVVAADFTNDGILGLAAVNPGSNSVSVLLGSRNGTFQAPRNVAVGAFPFVIAAGDLNGDGIPDLVTLNMGASPDYVGTVSVLLGNGDGTFQPANTFAVRQSGEGSNALALADVTGNGKLDIIVGNSYPNDAVAVFLGNGDGTFQAPVKTLLGSQGGTIDSVAVGDFNGDHQPDLVAVTGSLPYSATILFGNGNGTFRTGPRFALGDGGSADPHGVVVADFNRDGSLDFAVGGGDITVYLGHGNGSFAAATTYHVPYFGWGALRVADLNGDGVPDLVSSSSYYQVNVLLGNGDGSFQAPRTLAPGFATAMATGDFNGDGQTDLAVVNRSGGLGVYLGNGDGSFQTGAPPTLPSGDGILGAADLNGDGVPDLLAGGGNTFSGQLDILPGNGDGTFGDPVTYALPFTPTSVAVADYNGDQIPDLAVTGPGVRGSGTTVRVLFGNGDGTFGDSRDLSVLNSGPRQVTVADLNGDGIPDLVVTVPGQAPSFNNTISVLLGNGDGSFQPAASYTVGIDPTSVAVADVDGDGVPDLIVTYAGTSVGMVPGGVNVLRGNGDGTFQNASIVTSGFTATSVVAADFNRDGRLDLAVTDATDGQVRVYLGNGDGTFQSPASYDVGPNPTSLAVGDFRQIGRLDLAVGGPVGVRILSGRRDGTFRSHPVSYGPAANFVAVTDLNGDGFPDLLSDHAVLINRRRTPPAGAPSGRPAARALPAADGLTQPAATTPPTPVLPVKVGAASSTGLDPASVTSYFAALASENPGDGWHPAQPRSLAASPPARLRAGAPKDPFAGSVEG